MKKWLVKNCAGGLYLGPQGFGSLADATRFESEVAARTASRDYRDLDDSDEDHMILVEGEKIGYIW